MIDYLDKLGVDTGATKDAIRRFANLHNQGKVWLNKNLGGLWHPGVHVYWSTAGWSTAGIAIDFVDDCGNWGYQTEYLGRDASWHDVPDDCIDITELIFPVEPEVEEPDLDSALDTLRRILTPKVDSISDVASKVHRLARDKGWWEGAKDALNPQLILTKLMLVTTELAEAAELVRVKEFNALTSGSDGVSKPEGLGIELADAIIRLLDLAEWLGFDIGNLIDIKHNYNEGRSYRHGGKAA